MSETTAMRKRVILGAAGLVAAAAWFAAASYLWRTSVPHLQLTGLNEHRYFSAHQLARTSSYGTGEDVLWLLATVARLGALVVLALRGPRIARGIGLGPIGS